MPDQTPMPLQDPIASPRPSGRGDPPEGYITQPWIYYFTSIGGTVSAGPTRLTAVSLTAQAASIGATSIGSGAPTSGLYRLTYYAHITTAATVSSSLTVTFGWTDGGTNLNISGSAITGNTTTTVGTGTAMVHNDQASPLTYATTYASVGATSMQYALYVVLEQVA